MKIGGCGQGKIFTDDELTAFFATGLRCQRDRSLFDICRYTGCRIGESRQLQVAHVFDGQQIRGKITIPKAATKGKQATREINTHPRLRQSLEIYFSQSAQLLQIHKLVGDWDIKSTRCAENIDEGGNPLCPKCRGHEFSKAGKSRGKKVLKCKSCRYRFLEKAAFFEYPELKIKVLELGVFNSYSFGFLDLASGNPYLFPGSGGQGHLSNTAAQETFNDACKRIKLEGASTHSFRRTALTKMSDAGIPLRVIQKISGHTRLNNLQRYLEVKPKQLRAAVYQLYPLFDEGIYHYGRKNHAG